MVQITIRNWFMQIYFKYIRIICFIFAIVFVLICAENEANGFSSNSGNEVTCYETIGGPRVFAIFRCGRCKSDKAKTFQQRSKCTYGKINS